MRARILALRRNVSVVFDGRRYASKQRCEAHMNELPVPCGPWGPWYEDKQSYYNKFLIAGALWFIFSFGMFIYTDCVFFNWSHPMQPAPPSDMVEECDDSEN